MVIQLLYHKKCHFTKFLIYVGLSIVMFGGLTFLVSSSYYNMLMTLPVMIFGIYHFYEWQRLSNVIQVDLQSDKIGLIKEGTVDWLDKNKILRTHLYYSTIDKPMASSTLCISYEGGRSIRIPGFPNIDKLFDHILMLNDKDIKNVEKTH